MTKFLVVEVKDDAGNVLGTVRVDPKHFATESDGFFASTKLNDVQEPGVKYQCNLQFVEIGSKERNKAKKAG